MAKQYYNNLPKPSISQIKKAIEQSGYLLEQRICPIIEKYDFETIPNEQYQDQDTGKSREIDVYAWDEDSLFRSDFRDIFETILLIQCKNNKTPVVFFTQRNPIYISGEIALSGYPDGISVEDGKGWFTSIEDYFNFRKFHHYYKSKWIAHQFCQLKPNVFIIKGQQQKFEWEASHEELYESIDGLAKATDFFSSEFMNSIILDEEQKDFISLEIIYPILLFAGQLFECRIIGKDYNLFERNHLIFYKKIQSKTLEVNYHIDVIHEDYLQEFLNIIKKENDEIVNRLKRKYKLLKANVERNFKESKEEKKSKK